MYRIIFFIKKLCDRYLYGQVLIPAKHCPGCGRPLLAGESVTPPYHAICSPSIIVSKEVPSNG